MKLHCLTHSFPSDITMTILLNTAGRSLSNTISEKKLFSLIDRTLIQVCIESKSTPRDMAPQNIFHSTDFHMSMVQYFQHQEASLSLLPPPSPTPPSPPPHLTLLGNIGLLKISFAYQALNSFLRQGKFLRIVLFVPGTNRPYLLFVHYIWLSNKNVAK